jgi:hypothetical protein
MTGRTVIGAVGGITPRPVATLVRPADATAYAAQDHIANSGTGSAVVPLEFVVGGASATGIIAGARCVAKATSGALVTTNFAFDLLLFRPATSIPFAAGSYPADNAALTLTSAAMIQCVGIVSFVAAGWRTAGLETGAGHQVKGLASGLSFETFSLMGLGAANKLLGVVQAKAAWDPGNVIQTLSFELLTQGD